jgi:hypothetical protein
MQTKDQNRPSINKHMNVAIVICIVTGISQIGLALICGFLLNSRGLLFSNPQSTNIEFTISILFTLKVLTLVTCPTLGILLLYLAWGMRGWRKHLAPQGITPEV